MDPQFSIPADLAAHYARFQSRLVEAPPCLLYHCKSTVPGYGRFYIGDKGWVAHLYAWTMAYGPIPPGRMICHRCERLYPKGDITYRRCVRLDHLYLGDARTNALDRERTGRANHLVPLGEAHGMAKLTEREVREIRKAWKPGGLSQGQLAEVYGVTQGAVWLIIHRKVWRHIV